MGWIATNQSLSRPVYSRDNSQKIDPCLLSARLCHSAGSGWNWRASFPPDVCGPLSLIPMHLCSPMSPLVPGTPPPHQSKYSGFSLILPPCSQVKTPSLDSIFPLFFWPRDFHQSLFMSSTVCHVWLEGLSQDSILSWSASKVHVFASKKQLGMGPYKSSRFLISSCWMPGWTVQASQKDYARIFNKDVFRTAENLRLSQMTPTWLWALPRISVCTLKGLCIP